MASVRFYRLTQFPARHKNSIKTIVSTATELYILEEIYMESYYSLLRENTVALLSILASEVQLYYRVIA